MTKVTYLLGAGASYNSLPLINTMNDRMQFFVNCLRMGLIEHGLEKVEQGYLVNLFSPMLEDIKMHHTVDTFAKKLYIKSKQKDKSTTDRLLNLKGFLSCYFVFEQFNNLSFDELQKFAPKDLFAETSLNKGTLEFQEEHLKFIKKILNVLPDYRYDVFLASLIDDNLELPKEVSILSWNYDTQIELAYQNFSNKKELNIFPIHLPTKGYNNQKEYDEILLRNKQCLKLNGSAGYILSKLRSKYEAIFTTINSWHIPENAIQNEFKIFLEQDRYMHQLGEHSKGHTFLNFSWELESNEISSSVIGRAKEIVLNTEVLVVIGYSFPAFNRRIDSQILEHCDASKIYVQVAAKDFSSVQESLYQLTGHIEKENIILIDNLETFYIPFELII